jgi:hypothetical protein
VLDSFVGSGTTTLEAHLFGLNSIGIDISPVCQIVSRVKVSAGEVAKEIPQLRRKAISAMKQDFNNFSKIKSKTIKETSTTSYDEFLSSIKDGRVREFYLLASLIFASDLGRRRRHFDSFEKNLTTMITSALDLARTQKELRSFKQLGKVSIRSGDARDLDSIDAESIDAIVTSPPYSIALDYTHNDRHALEELGIDAAELSEKCIGVKGNGRRKLELYDSDMKKSYDEMYRVLKKGGKCVTVIGEATVDGEFTKNVQIAREYCQSIGFRLKEELPKKIYGLYNTIKDERVLFFEK